jgi:hypothetical protein
MEEKMKPQCIWQRYRSSVRTALVTVAFLVLITTGASRAQEIYAYPAKGKSHAQQEKDLAECRTIATQSTGYDPAKAQAAAQPQVTAPNSKPGGGRARGAARGALAGGVRAEAKGQQYQAYENAPEELKQQYRQNEARSGAQVGTAVGGAAQRRQRRQQAQQQTPQQASAQQQQSQQAVTFDQAYKSCLTGRGYSVN